MTTFEDILDRKLGKTKNRTQKAKLKTDLIVKGLDLKGTFELRAEDDGVTEDISEYALQAASQRVDNILEDVISESLVDSRGSKVKKVGKVSVPSAIYGLRDKSGRIVSAIGLSRLINAVLYKHVQENMGKPKLVNRTGRFAHSAHVTRVNKTSTDKKGRNRVSFFFSYMLYPYQVFEKHKHRDPRPLIRDSIKQALKDILHPKSLKSNVFTIWESK